MDDNEQHDFTTFHDVGLAEVDAKFTNEKRVRKSAEKLCKNREGMMVNGFFPGVIVNFACDFS